MSEADDEKSMDEGRGELAAVSSWDGSVEIVESWPRVGKATTNVSQLWLWWMVVVLGGLFIRFHWCFEGEASFEVLGSIPSVICCALPLEAYEVFGFGGGGVGKDVWMVVWCFFL